MGVNPNCWDLECLEKTSGQERVMLSDDRVSPESSPLQIVSVLDGKEDLRLKF